MTSSLLFKYTRAKTSSPESPICLLSLFPSKNSFTTWKEITWKIVLWSTIGRIIFTDAGGHTICSYQKGPKKATLWNCLWWYLTLKSTRCVSTFFRLQLNIKHSFLPVHFTHFTKQNLCSGPSSTSTWRLQTRISSMRKVKRQISGFASNGLPVQSQRKTRCQDDEWFLDTQHEDAANHNYIFRYCWENLM